jgi:FkbM family methyltransferase
LVIGDVANTAADAMAHIVDGAPTGQTFTEVRLTRLDDLEIPNRSRLSFVKCDVDGHKDAVLRGAEGTIRELLPGLLVEIEERHRDHPVSDAFELLTAWGTAAIRRRLVPRE